MAAVSVTNQLSALHDVFDKIKEVYYVARPNTPLASLATFDMEWPVISDGVSFDTGEPSITKVKLTSGETWTTMSEAGDPTITFQVGSFSPEIADLFLNKETEEEVAMTNTVNGVTFGGIGYNLEPKKINCGIFMVAENREVAIYMPNVEVFANMVIEEDRPAYFNANITPLVSDTGDTLFILRPTGAIRRRTAKTTL